MKTDGSPGTTRPRPASGRPTAAGGGGGHALRMNLFVLVKLLFQYLERVDRSALHLAKEVLKDCERKHNTKDSKYETLADAIGERLRDAVGETHWAKAKKIQKQLALNQQQKKLKAIQLKRQRAAAASQPSEPRDPWARLGAGRSRNEEMEAARAMAAWSRRSMASATSSSSSSNSSALVAPASKALDQDADNDKALGVASSPPKKPALARRNSGERTALLGLRQTKAGPIRELLSSSGFDVTVLQSSHEILRFARENEPSAIVLDDRLLGLTGLEVSEAVRTDMGPWGEHVTLMVIASSKEGEDQQGASSEWKKKQTADRLQLDDYVQGSFSPSYLLERIQASLRHMPLRWRCAPYPSKESQRVAALEGTGLLDSDPEERFETITRLCASMFKVNISAVSLVDKNRQFFKAIEGLPGVRETPRDQAFCSHAILKDGIMVVPDALQDDRFADNPLVAGKPNIRFYAGCPINVPSKEGNMPIGTLCLIDSKPRDLREEEFRSLKDFGAMVAREVSNSSLKELVSKC